MRLVGTPTSLASTMIKVKGRKEPRKKKKVPIAKSRNGASINGIIYSFSNHGFLIGGKRDSMARLPKIRSPRTKNPMIRIAHPKPNSSSR